MEAASKPDPAPSPALSAPAGPAVSQGSIGQNVWYRKYDGQVVIVFVHGIRSSSVTCWRSTQHVADGTYPYWPNLIHRDPRFQGVSIYLGGFYADIDSDFLGIPQVSHELYNALRRREEGRSVLEFETIIFICHSLGGIIVRNILLDQYEEFRDKKIGLILIASPSTGSTYADLAAAIIKLYRNKLARQLKFGNDMLMNLDYRFRILVDEREKRMPGLRGIEAYEHHFPWHSRWLPSFPPIVTIWSANRFFQPYPLPGTNHSTCVKPLNYGHPAYQLLVDFLANQMEMSLPLPSPACSLIVAPDGETVHSARKEKQPMAHLSPLFLVFLAVLALSVGWWVFNGQQQPVTILVGLTSWLSHRNHPSPEKVQQSSLAASERESLNPEGSPGLVKVNPKDGLPYVYVPHGEFGMGCSDADTECYADEGPRPISLG
jgi:hypothetical protein